MPNISADAKPSHRRNRMLFPNSSPTLVFSPTSKYNNESVVGQKSNDGIESAALKGRKYLSDGQSPSEYTN
ncbi:MAG TPA: hypothetical protein PK850_02945 [Ignavibacteria bacterium]|nr:hypothetical protein [Ignavibacteria bacterium]